MNQQNTQYVVSVVKMRVVAGVLVVAVNSLLVEAAWLGGAPAVRLA